MYEWRLRASKSLPSLLMVWLVCIYSYSTLKTFNQGPRQICLVLSDWNFPREQEIIFPWETSIPQIEYWSGAGDYFYWFSFVFHRFDVQMLRSALIIWDWRRIVLHISFSIVNCILRYFASAFKVCGDYKFNLSGLVLGNPIANSSPWSNWIHSQVLRVVLLWV